MYKISIFLKSFISIFLLLFSCSTSIMEQNFETEKINQYLNNSVKLDPVEKKASVGYFYSDYNNSLPEIVDLSSNMPPVGDQGSQGSCTAWAVAYAAKSYQEGIEENWDLSNQSHQFSPSFLYNQIRDGFVSLTLDMLVDKGCDTLNNFPYNPHDKTTLPDVKSFKRALKYKAKSWKYLKKDVTELKKILASGNVVIGVIAVHNDFNILSKKNPIYDDFSGKRYAHHSICIVGYDDSKSAFKFINSWGTDWGIDGYGYISYSAVYEDSPYFCEAYIMFDDKNIDREKKVIHYYSQNDIKYIHYKQDNNIWTNIPGKEMTYEKDGWYVYVLEDKDDFEFCFNSGYYSPIWDSKYGANYKTTLNEVWIKDYTIYDYNPLSVDLKLIVKNSNNNMPIKDISFSVKNKNNDDIFYIKTDEYGIAWLENVKSGEYTIFSNVYNYLYENNSTMFSFDITINNKTFIKEIYLTPACSTTIYLTKNNDNNTSSYELVGLNGSLYKNGVFYKNYISSSYYGNGYFSLGYLTQGEYKLVISDKKNDKIYNGEITFSINENTNYYSNTMFVSSFKANFSMVYLRGSFNDWSTSKMNIVKDNIWELEVDFNKDYDNKFKFDIYGDWQLNYGDNNNDGICEQNGNDIFVTKGRYLIKFNDVNKSYWFEKR
ncbi:MAG TPA: C1 family peptidase [Spirochaetota bacterium]|nr:C1 family peptidase [Spirochaetota bacterium]